jgi:hypothetical protein
MHPTEDIIYYEIKKINDIGLPLEKKVYIKTHNGRYILDKSDILKLVYDKRLTEDNKRLFLLLLKRI